MLCKLKGAGFADVQWHIGKTHDHDLEACGLIIIIITTEHLINIAP